MDIKRITEVGIAVPELDSACELFEHLLGATVSEEQVVELYQMRYKMCRVGRVDFEVMAPLGESGVIAEFLERRGPGLHHIAFAVDDLAMGMQTMQAKGVSFVDELPVALRLSGMDFAGRSFDGETKIAFSHPKSILGILFEFIEYPDGYRVD